MASNSVHSQTGIAPDVGVPHARTGREAIRAAIAWGVVFGLLQAIAPLIVWRLPPAAIYGLSLILIASVYPGFAVVDGRPVAAPLSVCCGYTMVAPLLLGVGRPGEQRRCRPIKQPWMQCVIIKT